MTGLPFRHRWRDEVTLSTDDRVDALALAVVTALHLHMTPEGVCSVGLRRLASLARVSVPTVRRRLSALEAAGLLEVDRSGRARTVYRATLPDEPSAVQPGCTDAGETLCNPGADTVQPGDTNCATGLHMFPYQLRTPSARTREPVEGRQPTAARQRVREPWERSPVDRPPAPLPPLWEQSGALWAGGPPVAESPPVPDPGPIVDLSGVDRARAALHAARSSLGVPA